VNVFAIAIERYERLVAGAGSGPRSRSRRSASAAVKPLLAATTVSLTRRTRYTPSTMPQHVIAPFGESYELLRVCGRISA